MMPIAIHKAIEINAPAARVWRYIGTEAGLRRWWGVNITLEAKQGGRCEERSLFNGQRRYFAGEVTVYDPPRQLVLFLRQQDEVATWPALMTISLTLKEENERTVVTLEHQAVGWAAVETTPGWAVPPIQIPAPERQVILNQLPTLDRFTVTATARQPMYSVEQTWLRQYTARWDSDLNQLQQMVQEA